jgi:hypothetical protein
MQLSCRLTAAALRNPFARRSAHSRTRNLAAILWPAQARGYHPTAARCGRDADKHPGRDKLQDKHPDRAAAGQQHDRPTLESFSLEGKVCVVTGGAGGLGLVMGQGMIYSGADLAIVDLNRT